MKPIQKYHFISNMIKKDDILNTHPFMIRWKKAIDEMASELKKPKKKRAKRKRTVRPQRKND